MIATRSITTIASLILGLSICSSAYAAATDISSVPLNTFQATSSADVKPNVMFILDDSGSMGWDYLPDWANDNSPPDYYFKNSAFNGVAYNSSLIYTPPVTYDASGAINTTLYISMTGVSAATGGDGTATSGSPNWKAVKNDGFGIQSAGTSNLVNNAFFYTSIAGEYCSEVSFRNCTTATVPTTIGSVTYSLPAILRWCDSTGLTTCKATNGGAYVNRRMAIPRSATITVSGSVSTSVTGITVNSQQIMSGTAAASTTSSTVATNIAAQINLCSNNIVGNCQVLGYTASVSGSKVTIFAPATINYTPVVTPSPLTGGMTFTTTSFVAGTVPGENLRTTITPSINSYTYAGTASKAPGRTDCAGTTCTYTEEMTNYANWWAYYHTRMQMMKTAASQAFSNLDSALDVSNNVSRFRVGYMSINNNTGADFVNMGEFKTTQKNNWYTKFLNALPGNSTPLREALADAGRIYAGKKNGSTYNGVIVTDPLQYSCQANYTILSTDGFWNGNAGYKLDGTTAVGNVDAGLGRPYSDGASVTQQTRTSTLQSRTITSQLQIQTSSLQKQISQLQKKTSSLQSSTSQLQVSTSANSGSTWSAWSNTVSCTWDNSGPTRTKCQYLAYTAPATVASCTALAQGTSTSNGQTWAGPAKACTYTAWSAPVGVSTCTNVNQSTGPTNYTVGTATQCNTVVTSAYANSASCTVAATPDINGYTTQCQYSPATWTAWANTASCTPAAKSTGPNYTVGTAIQCQTLTTNGPWVNAASCTASSTQGCQYTAWTSWSNVGTCSAIAQSSSPNYTVATARECSTSSSGGTSDTLADVAAYYYGTDLRSPTATGADATGTCTGPIIAPSITANNLCDDNVKSFGRDVATRQHMTTFTLGLGAEGAMVYSKAKSYDYWKDISGDFYDIKNGTTANPTNGICSWQTSGSCEWPAPAANSLNNIDDLWHAAVNGRGTYFSASDPETLSYSISSTLKTINNTPKPGTAAAAASSNPNISSSDNFVFSSSYKSVEWFGELIRQQLDATTGTLTSPQWSAMSLLDCATTPWTANTAYVVGQTYNYGSKCYKVALNYTSGATFDATVGVVTTVDTSSTAKIVLNTSTTPVDVTPLASRTIYTTNGSALIPFTWAGLSATQKVYFTAPAVTYVNSTTGLSQFCTIGACLTASEQSNTTTASGGAAGENMVNFLRGDRTNEGTFYRARTHVLGDIISSEGRYVKKPLFQYTDSGYSAYVDSVATRKGMVYVAANDGMLHAFEADSGQETWAYIPGLVLPQIYRLADKDYTNLHRYFVDGTPEVGEICPNAPASCSSSQWKTILVGGLNLGGKGFYAMDVTNPDAPVLLWEISNTTSGFSNLGYSFSNPRITKLKDGRWVVIFASGYNNADGAGHVYVVNAQTGGLISDISNGTGNATTPSGLARISAHVPQSSTNNTTQAVYGGDLLGNLWRFDINGDIGTPGYDAQLLVTLKDAGGTPQPITSKPTMTSVVGVVSGVSTVYPVVFVGTGRYLGVSDVTPTSTQVESFYGIKDNLGTTTYGNPHTAANGFIQQVMLDTTCPSGAPVSICTPNQQVRTITSNAVDWGVKNGWYFDFVAASERSVTDSSLGISTLVFTTISPLGSTADVCGDPNGSSGTSFACAVDYMTGGAVTGSYNVACTSLGAGIATRPVLIELSDGTVVELIRKGKVTDDPDPTPPGGTTTGGTDMGDTQIVRPTIKPLTAGGARRVSWRKLQM